MSDTEKHEPAADNTAMISMALIVLTAIISPSTLIVAGITYFLFAKSRIRLMTIGLLGLLPSLAILAIFWNATIQLFTTTWTETLPAIIAQEIEPVPALVHFYLLQTPLSFPIGLILGMGYSAYRFSKKAKWEEVKFRLTPWQWYKKRKTIEQIRTHSNVPSDGMTLGIDDEGKRVVQTYHESSAHTLVLGASGTGKTTTMKSRLADSISVGQGALIIDLKGDPKFVWEVYEMAQREGRKFVHWTMQPRGVPYIGPAVDGPAYYDPISRGDATRRKDLLMEMREWSEDHYRIAAGNYLQTVMHVIIGNPKPGASILSQLVELLDPKALQTRAIPLGSNPLYQDVVRYIDDMNDQKMDSKIKANIDGLKSMFNDLLGSVSGQYLQTDPDTTRNNNINLRDVAHNGDVVFFSLDSSNYQTTAAVIANLLIQDLKTVSSELRSDPLNQPFQVLIDEFQAIGSSNVIGLINKSRDAQLPVTLATQSLGDLRQINTAFLDQLIGIVGSFIIHRPNSRDDAILFAGLTGTVMRMKATEAYSAGQGILKSGETLGTGMLQEVEDYTITPDEITRLKQGEMVYVNKSISPMKVVKVLCIPEDASLARRKNESDPQSSSKTRRNEHQTGNDDTSNASLPVVTPPDQGSELPLFSPNTITEPANAPQDAHSDRSLEHYDNAPNIDRLRQIFNQDPDELLKDKSGRTDHYTVKVMPPSVAKPLNPPKPDTGSNGVHQFPKLPALPPLPGKPTVKPTPTLPGASTSGNNIPITKPAPTNVPKLPVTPPTIKPVPPITKSESTKDEYDF